MIFSVPYRWRPRTFFMNIGWIFYDIWRGILNIIRWTPVIWHDRDYDWAYLAEVMEYKLRRMSKLFGTGHHVSSERDARRMLICAELLKRLRMESYQCPDNGLPITPANVKRDGMVGRSYQEYIGKIIGKHLRGWWE
jgi:hypothetical protein